MSDPLPPPSRRLVLAALPAFVTACSPLAVLDGVMPRDGGSRQAAEGLSYAAGDRRRLDVYAPEAPPPDGRGRPVVVFTYGGSWASGERTDYGFVGHALAAAGFVTVVYDYRLVPEVTFPGFVEDGAAAVRWTVDHVADFGGDPGRIALVGHSAGAYTTAMLALDRRFLAAAGVARGRVKAAVGLAGPYDFLPFDVEATRDAFGGFPDPAATQPVNRVRRGAPPFLLATGDADDTVKPRNTTALAGRLRAVGVPVTTRLYPGVGHAGILLALGRPFRDRAPVLADVTGFLVERLG